VLCAKPKVGLDWFKKRTEAKFQNRFPTFLQVIRNRKIKKYVFDYAGNGLQSEKTKTR